MRSRPAALTLAALAGLALGGCGGAVGDPVPANADERQVLEEAREMLPQPRRSGTGEAPAEGRDPPPA